jgi:hypothetical protein
MLICKILTIYYENNLLDLKFFTGYSRILMASLGERDFLNNVF